MDTVVQVTKRTQLGLKHDLLSGFLGFFQEKTGIDARFTILGHVQRGGSPTVRDRVEATRMGYYAVELLEQGIGNRVVGVKDSKLVDYDIQEALSMHKEYDEKLHHIAEEIAY